MGPNTSSQKQQLATQNALQAQQQSSQNALLAQNNSALSPYLTGNQGFTPAQMAALNSAALDQNAQKYGSATQATNAALASRGEGAGGPSSGVAATGYGNLEAAKAGDLSNSLRTNVLNNAQQALANKFNAASVLSGNAQTYAGNVGTYGSGANSALGNLTTAQQGGFLNNLTKGVAGGLGQGLAAAATGGFGGGLSSLSSLFKGGGASTGSGYDGSEGGGAGGF